MLTVLALSLLLRPLYASALSFSYTPPTECDPLTVTWTGGTAPFSLLITPTFSTPYNLSIPASAYNNGQGSFTTQLPVASQKQFLLTVSDSTGDANSVTSALLTAGPRTGSSSCNTKPPDPAFEFQTPNALQQCRPYSISGYTGATLPITVTGLIPSGQRFILHPPAAGTEFQWTANIKSGTQIILIVTDAQGRSGGSSDIVPIGSSNDASCIDASSPSSTAGGPTSTTKTGSPSTTSGNAPQSSSPAKSGGVSGAVIGGAVAAAVVAVVIIVGFILFFLCRRKSKSKPYGDARRSQRMESIERLPGPLSPDTAELGEGRQHDYVPIPYVLPPSEHGTDHPSSGRQPGTSDARSQTPLSMLSSSAAPTSSSKAAVAAQAAQRENQAPTRFVLHTDGGSAYGGDHDEDEDEVVELPPQYTSLSPAERKASIRRDREAGRRAGRSGDAGASSSAGP